MVRKPNWRPTQEPRASLLALRQVRTSVASANRKPPRTMTPSEYVVHGGKSSRTMKFTANLIAQSIMAVLPSRRAFYNRFLRLIRGRMDRRLKHAFAVEIDDPAAMRIGFVLKSRSKSKSL